MCFIEWKEVFLDIVVGILVLSEFYAFHFFAEMEREALKHFSVLLRIFRNKCV